MKKLETRCISCGSNAVKTRTFDSEPPFGMAIIDFACGAVLKSTRPAIGRLRKVSITGCSGRPC